MFDLLDRIIRPKRNVVAVVQYTDIEKICVIRNPRSSTVIRHQTMISMTLTKRR